MKIKEGSSSAGAGKEYGLIIQTVIESPSGIGPEVEQIRLNVLAWIEKRGKECDTLDLVVTADVDDHDEIIRCVLHEINGDDTLNQRVPNLKRARLMLWNREQTKYQSLLIKPESSNQVLK